MSGHSPFIWSGEDAKSLTDEDGTIRRKDGTDYFGGGGSSIQIYSGDKPGAVNCDLWIRKLGGGGNAGMPLGFLFLMTGAGTPASYDLSLKTDTGTIVRVPLTEY